MRGGGRSLQTGLVSCRVWFLPLLSVVSLKVLMVPVDAESRATAQGGGGESGSPPGSPGSTGLCSGVSSPRGIPSQAVHSSAKHSLQHLCSLRGQAWISPYTDPRISVF